MSTVWHVLLALVVLASGSEVHSQTTSPKGLAVLVGVQTYKPGGFDNLTTPCNDIIAVKKALEELESIEFRAVLCDATAKQFKDAANDLVFQLGERPRGTFGLIYFAGHGIQFGGDVFLFGTKANPRVAQIKARLQRSADYSRMAIFDPADAVSLLNDISPGDAAGNPVVMVIDACRSTSIGEDLRGQTPGSRIFMTQPQPDTLIAFSAAHGTEAIDVLPGMDVSPYAEAFKKSLLDPEGMSATDLFGGVRRTLRALIPPGFIRKRQEPAELNALETRVCFSQCPQCGELPRATSTSRRAVGQSPGFQKVQLASPPPPTSGGSGLPNSFVAWSADSNPVVAKKLLADAKPLRLDVFWCDKEIGGDGRSESPKPATYAKALEAVGKLKTVADEGVVLGGSMLSDIRVRRLSAEQQTKPGYQIHRDIIRYNAADQFEVDWTKFLRDSIANAQPSPADTPTPGYVSMFFCDTRSATR